MKEKKYKFLGNNLMVRDGIYFGRIKKSNGRWGQKKLGEFASIKEARERLNNYNEEEESERLDKAVRVSFVRQNTERLLRDYVDAGYPTAKWNKKRTSPDLDLSFKNLIEFFGRANPETLSIAECDDYVDWRRSIVAQNSTRYTGDRVAEMDLQNLSSAFNWSVRRRKLRVNPVKERQKYQHPDDVVHCTQKMPMTAEDLHKIAAKLTPTLRHQCLLEAYTGGRTGEIIELLADAEMNTPGFYNDDYLWIDRFKGGINPFVVMHDALKRLLDHITEYKREHFPHSKYLLVGRDGISRIGKDSLTQALRKACIKMNHKHVCSHGLRAYYVRCCRSKGISDTEIAIRLGQRSGGRLVESTYVLPEPKWIGENKLDFEPKDQPAAWER